MGVNDEPTPSSNPNNEGFRGRLRWLGNLFSQETVLKPLLQGVGMFIGVVIVEQMGGNLQDVVYVGALGGFAVGAVAGEAVVRIRRHTAASS